MSNKSISIVEFPLETEEQAKEMANKILDKEQVVVTRIYKACQQWKEDGKVFGAEVFVVRCRVKTEKIDSLYQFVKENHPWPVFCFDVVTSTPKSEV